MLTWPPKSHNTRCVFFTVLKIIDSAAFFLTVVSLTSHWQFCCCWDSFLHSPSTILVCICVSFRAGEKKANLADFQGYRAQNDAEMVPTAVPEHLYMVAKNHRKRILAPPLKWKNISSASLPQSTSYHTYMFIAKQTPKIHPKKTIKQVNQVIT